MTQLYFLGEGGRMLSEGGPECPCTEHRCYEAGKISLCSLIHVLIPGASSPCFIHCSGGKQEGASLLFCPLLCCLVELYYSQKPSTFLQLFACCFQG